MEDRKVWILVYRLKIRARWSVVVLAFESMAAAEAHWEHTKDNAMSSGWDYDLLFKSLEEGSDVNEMRLQKAKA